MAVVLQKRLVANNLYAGKDELVRMGEIVDEDLSPADHC